MNVKSILGVIIGMTLKISTDNGTTFGPVLVLATNGTISSSTSSRGGT
jgi:hypothetical protein